MSVSGDVFGMSVCLLFLSFMLGGSSSGPIYIATIFRWALGPSTADASFGLSIARPSSMTVGALQLVYFFPLATSVWEGGPDSFVSQRAVLSPHLVYATVWSANGFVSLFLFSV